MNKKLNFAIIGGDMRQIYLAKQLKEDGHSAWMYASDPSLALNLSDGPLSFEKLDCVVLPLPALRDDEYINTPLSDIRLRLDDLFSWLAPGTTVVAGRVSKPLLETAKKYNLEITDYFEREELAVLNAVPTVEGAIAIAMDETPFTLFGSNILIIGFGRIGKLLANRLHFFGCNITVSARKYADFAWIDAYGYKKVKTSELDSIVRDQQLIFNTVPSQIITPPLLDKLNKDVLIIDLASAPGGAGFKPAPFFTPG